MGREETLTKNKGGRPKKEIDYKLVERLAKIHCTQQEIADILDLSLNKCTGDAEFMVIYKKGISNAKMSLRRKQWQAVEKGNVGMMIWLGKQYLGQREPVTLIEETPIMPEFVNKTDSELDATIEKLNKKNGN